MFYTWRKRAGIQIVVSSISPCDSLEDQSATTSTTTSGCPHPPVAERPPTFKTSTTAETPSFKNNMSPQQPQLRKPCCIFMGEKKHPSQGGNSYLQGMGKEVITWYQLGLLLISPDLAVHSKSIKIHQCGRAGCGSGCLSRTVTHGQNMIRGITCPNIKFMGSIMFGWHCFELCIQRAQLQMLMHFYQIWIRQLLLFFPPKLLGQSIFLIWGENCFLPHARGLIGKSTSIKRRCFGRGTILLEGQM